ncbi:hypothetical protein I4F81_010017 [Pyropia yezoensis]|uniref:Uncharacterized protein n=1 Tax=Pyropia yezoensis TaxID=2788 RepID=A0ACC3CB94_PYRYE|nr:hypothetical protein I4F81_010017 [Neopyropia yezoensis]
MWVVMANAVRAEAMSTYALLLSVQRRWSRLTGSDLRAVVTFWAVTHHFIEVTLAVERGTLLPALLASASAAAAAAGRPPPADLVAYVAVAGPASRARLAAALTSIRELLAAPPPPAALLHALYTALLSLLPSLLAHLAGLHAAALPHAPPVADHAAVAAAYAARGRAREGLALLGRGFGADSDRRQWAVAALGVARAGALEGWMAAVDAAHGGIVGLGLGGGERRVTFGGRTSWLWGGGRRRSRGRLWDDAASEE